MSPVQIVSIHLESFFKPALFKNTSTFFSSWVSFASFVTFFLSFQVLRHFYLHCWMLPFKRHHSLFVSFSLSLFFLFLSLSHSFWLYLSLSNLLHSLFLFLFLSLSLFFYLHWSSAFIPSAFVSSMCVVSPFRNFIFSPFSSSLSIAAAAVVTFYSAALRGDKTQFIAACHSDSIVCSFCSEAAKKITSPAAAENTKRNLF